MSPEVRWKKGERWRYGQWRDLAQGSDGSLTIYEKDRRLDHHGNRARSLMPERVEVRNAGPRGGERWVGASELLEAGDG